VRTAEEVLIISRYLDYMKINSTKGDELERIKKKWIVAYSWYYHDNFLQRLRKATQTSSKDNTYTNNESNLTPHK
jgi:hypothetical protein